MERVRTPQPYDTSRLPDEDIMEHPIVANAPDEEAYCRRESPGIDYFVHTFLDNTKHRFGEHSVEVTTINSILSTFRSGNVSKRDALSSITLALGTQQDLKQDLMNVLYHKDAKWGAGDFDFDQPVTQSVTQPCPPFLQPAHEPPLRLPPISTSWCLDHQVVQSINPAVLSGYGGPTNFGYQDYAEPSYAQRAWQPIAPMPSSPMSQMHTNYQLLNPLTSPALNRSTNFSPYTGASYDSGPGPVHKDFSRIPQDDHMQADWGNTDYGEEHATNGSPKKEVFADASPYILGNPLAVPIGRPAIDMSPPPKKGSRRGSVAHVKTVQHHGEDVAGDQSLSTSPNTAPTQTPVTHRPKGKRDSTANATQPRSEGGLFIHSLCGKAFTKRSKVKKHHWGARNDDIETKTGCWAKHNKPHVKWDEHPSCREDTPATRVVKKASSQSTPGSKEPKYKAPVVPAMIPSHNLVDGFPTLKDLPQTVAQALTPTQDTFKDVGAYHSHRLPARGSFDSLLTAVNLASWIDAPKPQGRNDSVVSHLNAQAVAAERHGQHIPAWIEASRGHGEDGLTYDHSPGIGNGLGINQPNGKMQVPSGRTIPSQIEDDGYNSSSISPTDTNWNIGHTFGPLKRDRARFGSSILPDPETKRQRG